MKKDWTCVDYMHSFKSFEVTDVNQELLTLTHVMKGCTIMQISTTSDPNIAKVQPSFMKQFYHGLEQSLI